MEKTVSKNGVKINMCRASRKHNDTALAGHDYKRIRLKKERNHKGRVRQA